MENSTSKEWDAKDFSGAFRLQGGNDDNRANASLRDTRHRSPSMFVRRAETESRPTRR